MNSKPLPEFTRVAKKKRAPIDGGLRPLFRKKLSIGWQWTTIETGATTGGVPDAEYCTRGGAQGWIEFKACSGWRPTIRPLQVSWIARRARLGGRVFIAVVRERTELWLIGGQNVVALADQGLRASGGLTFHGGPQRWDWKEIAKVLTA